MNLNFTDLNPDILGLILSQSPPSVHIAMYNVCKSFRSLDPLTLTAIMNKFGSNWKEVMINDSLAYNNISYYGYSLRVLGLAVKWQHLSIAAFHGSLNILGFLSKRILSKNLEGNKMCSVCDNAAKGGHLDQRKILEIIVLNFYVVSTNTINIKN